MEKEKLVRFNLMISPTQLKEIDQYRKEIGTLDSRGLVIREFIKKVLDEHYKYSVGRED